MQKLWSVFFGVVLTAIFALCAVSPWVGWWLPQNVSSYGGDVDALFYIILAIPGVAFLVTEGDLRSMADGTIYVDGWDQWQEGDLSVADRMAALRNRKGNGATRSPGSERTAHWRPRHDVFPRDLHTCRSSGIARYPRPWPLAGPAPSAGAECPGRPRPAGSAGTRTTRAQSQRADAHRRRARPASDRPARPASPVTAAHAHALRSFSAASRADAAAAPRFRGTTNWAAD